MTADINFFVYLAHRDNYLQTWCMKLSFLLTLELRNPNINFFQRMDIRMSYWPIVSSTKSHTLFNVSIVYTGPWLQNVGLIGIKDIMLNNYNIKYWMLKIHVNQELFETLTEGWLQWWNFTLFSCIHHVIPLYLCQLYCIRFHLLSSLQKIVSIITFIFFAMRREFLKKDYTCQADIFRQSEIYLFFYIRKFFLI